MILAANRLHQVFILFIVGLGTGCIESSRLKLFSISGETMGTTYLVKFVADKETELKPIRTRIAKDLAEVNRQMSTYIKDSEISQLNQAKAGENIAISAWFQRTLQYSLDLAAKTEGAFDPTVGPLVNLWGFGPGKIRATPPTNEEVDRVRKYVGYQKVRILREEDGWVAVKTHDKVYVDLSASAKGFGVDVISKALQSFQIEDHLVEIGGELYARGNKKGAAWKVAIEKPDTEKRAIQKVIELNNQALATSGSYRNFFTSEGKTYSHTIDQQTGKPVQHRLVSVSIVAGSCLEADALATAMMAMGDQKALSFARQNKIAAYFITGGNVDGKLQVEVQATETFNNLGGSR